MDPARSNAGSIRPKVPVGQNDQVIGDAPVVTIRTRRNWAWTPSPSSN